MALILNIETATNICSVSLSRDGEVISFIDNDEEKSHAKLLTVFINSLLKENNLKVKDLDAVAVSKGPGSYTGLRIGVSVAKGLCYAENLPLIAIDTLQSMASGINEYQKNIGHETILCPMLDARRMEVYYAFFDWKASFITDVKAQVLDAQTFADSLKDREILFFGNGAFKLQKLVDHKNAVFNDDYLISARHMSALAETHFKNRKFVDVAYFEPFYLKDFIATKPKKNFF